MRAAIFGLTVCVASLSLSWPSLAQDETRPAALVESVKGAPNAGVEFLDYVFPGQTINLGADGVIVLSYFKSCAVETVEGGELTVDDGTSKVEDGKVETKKIPCQGPNIVISKETGEAGASVNRVTPFDGQNWSEWTTKSKTPIFKWKQKGQATVTVLDLDTAPPVVVWTGSVDGSHLAYPRDAPPLQIGIPYQARVAVGNAEPVGAAFSIDPDLEGPDTVMSRIIPVGK